ncbi:hypothetical protein GCM10027085_41290 [Spirosoma aerophilum]
MVGGCQSNSEPTPDDLAYFPLQVGDYWIYQVTQENYSLTTGATTRIFQRQEKVGSALTQNGQIVYQLEVSTRPSEQANWQLNAIRAVSKSLSEVVSQENNVPALQLVFPISATTSWNLNTYNARPDTLLQYRNKGRSVTISKRPYDQTISVVGPSDSTLIGSTKFIRIYAPDVGMIYRENAALAYCQSTPDCIGKGIIVSGTRQTWSLLSSNRLP